MFYQSRLVRCEGPQRVKSSLSEAIDHQNPNLLPRLFFFAGSFPKFKDNNKKGSQIIEILKINRDREKEHSTSKTQKKKHLRDKKTQRSEALRILHWE